MTFKVGIIVRQRLKGRWRELFDVLRNFVVANTKRTVLDLRPFFFDKALNFFDTFFMNKDLDAGLIFVVATAKAVVNTQDGFEIGEQIVLADEVTHSLANERCAAKPPTHNNFKPGFTRIILMHAKADIMHLDRRAVIWRTGHGNFEFARQIGEFRMECRPLTDQFAIRARIFDFIGRCTGILIGRCIPNAVARCLDGVHLDIGKIKQGIGNFVKLRPVILNILARGEMAIALVIFTRNAAKLTQLISAQRTVWDGNT